jgi:hypothetical protein
MKKMLFVHLVLALCVLAGSALAQPGADPVGERFAKANQWLYQEHMSITKTVTQAFRDGYIVIEGEGLPSARAATPGERRLTAQRAAEVVAYRNLVQFLNGVAVVGDSTTQDMKIRYDTVRSAVNGFIKGAQVIYKDYNDQEGSAMVLVKVGMTGPASFGELMYRKLLGNPQAAKDVTSSAPLVIVNPVPVESYDGMIIDATGENFRPALINRIFTQKGEVLYDPSRVEEKILVEKGCGEYTNSVDKARDALQRRGVRNPMVVKAAGVAGPTDLQVSEEDAVKIFSVNQKTDFLSGAKVAFVLK